MSEAVKISIGGDASGFAAVMHREVPAIAKRSMAMVNTVVGAGLKAAAAAVAGAGFLGGAILKSAAEFETLNMRLVTLMGSTSGATARMKELADFAASTPFTLSGLVEAEATLRGFGADAEEALPKVADLAGAMGLDLAEAASAVGRAFAGGAGAADVLRDRGVLAMMETRLGVKATSLSLAEFRAELLVTLDEFEGGAAALATTMPGLISTLRDEWERFAREVADAGIYDAAKEGLAILLGLLQDNREAIDQIARDTGVWAKGALLAAVQAAGALWKAWTNVRSVLLSVQGITEGVRVSMERTNAEIQRGMANMLPESMRAGLRTQAAASEARADAAQARMNILRGEGDDIQAELAAMDAEIEAFMTRIDNAGRGGATVEKAARDSTTADAQEAKKAAAAEEIDWAQRHQDALSVLTAEGEAERLRMAEQAAGQRLRIAEQGTNQLVALTQQGMEMRLNEEATGGEILRALSLGLFSDLLIQLAGYLAVKSAAHFAALDIPRGIALAAGAAVATAGAASLSAVSSNQAAAANGSASLSEASGGPTNPGRNRLDGGTATEDDGGLSAAADELKQAARDLTGAARALAREAGGGGGSSLRDMLTMERGLAGMRPSFRGS